MNLKWRVMDMYMDWKLGQLTEAHIDELVESCRKVKGTRWVEDPMDPSPDTFTRGGSSIAAFANDLKSELREPRLERFFQSPPKLDDAWGYGMTQMVGVACYPENPSAGLLDQEKEDQ